MFCQKFCVLLVFLELCQSTEISKHWINLTAMCSSDFICTHGNRYAKRVWLCVSAHNARALSLSMSSLAKPCAVAAVVAFSLSGRPQKKYRVPCYSRVFCDSVCLRYRVVTVVVAAAVLRCAMCVCRCLWCYFVLKKHTAILTDVALRCT